MKRLFVLLLSIVALVACDKPAPEPEPQPKPDPDPVVLPQDIVPNITQLGYESTSADGV